MKYKTTMLNAIIHSVQGVNIVIAECISNCNEEERQAFKKHCLLAPVAYPFSSSFNLIVRFTYLVLSLQCPFYTQTNCSDRMLPTL